MNPFLIPKIGDIEEGKSRGFTRDWRSPLVNFTDVAILKYFYTLGICHVSCLNLYRMLKICKAHHQVFSTVYMPLLCPRFQC